MTITTTITITTTVTSPRKVRAPRKSVKTPAYKTLSISAKVSDLFSGVLLDENDRVIGSRDGYVPAIFNRGDNDYVDFDIDLQTGRIVGWTRPAPVDLYKFRQRGEHLRVPRNEHTRRIGICAKTSDGFFASLLDANGNVVGEYDGYVLPCCHADSDDYVEMDIDVDSGQIIGWKGITKEEVARFRAPEAARRAA